MNLKENTIDYDSFIPEFKTTSMSINGQSLTFITKEVRPSISKDKNPISISIDKEAIEIFKKIALNYIKMPIILDDFDSHIERSQWRDALNKNDRDIVMKNKLILTRIAALQEIINYIGDNNNTDDILLNEEFNHYYKLKNVAYYELNNAEKMAYVSKLEQIAVNLLYLLTDVYDSK